MKIHSVFAQILMLITALSSDGQDVPKKDYSLRPPQFSELSSYKEMNSALDEALKAKPKITLEYVDSLIQQINQKEASDEGKTYAIFLLGELRVTNAIAVETLIEKIDFAAPQTELKLRIKLWGLYPAQEALVKIGIPAVNAISTHLPSETSKVRIHLMCDALQQIQGKEDTESLIKRLLSKETDPKRKSNLEKALDALRKGGGPQR